MQPTHDLIEPAAEPLPLLFDSPHSGWQRPADWAPCASEAQLATSWDAYVDELFAAAPEHGAALLRAHFPRSFVDLNRARDDLDPELVEGPLPFVPRPTGKSRVGMGVLRRLALPDVPVYAAPLPAAQVLGWLETYYDPYHATLRARIDSLHARFGLVRHVDCHSMKSVGNAMNDDAGRARPDFVVSDRDGTTADPAFTGFVAGCLRRHGYSVGVNNPYKGAHLVAAYGAPQRNIYSIQIEVNRSIYMDEISLEKRPEFRQVQQDIGEVIGEVAAYLRAEMGN